MCELLEYVIKKSSSGSAIVDVDFEELAHDADLLLWEELSDYLLDSLVYEENGKWCVDAMFGGYYVPGWDGICEDIF